MFCSWLPGRWVAKLIAGPLARAALWVRIQTSRKNTNGRHKQRSGQHTLSRQKNTVYKKMFPAVRNVLSSLRSEISYQYPFVSFNYFLHSKNALWAFFAPRDHVISHYADAGFPLARISQQPYQGPANAEVMRWVREESRWGSLYPGSFVHVCPACIIRIRNCSLMDPMEPATFCICTLLSVAVPMHLILNTACKHRSFSKPLGFVCVDGIFCVKNGGEISMYI